MSILNSFKINSDFRCGSNGFYENQTVAEIKWWLADGSTYPTLYWARLRIFVSGEADVLFENEDKSYGFETEEFASYFLAEDGFSQFDNLDEEGRNFLEIPSEIKIKVPDWTNKEVENFEYIGKY